MICLFPAQGLILPFQRKVVLLSGYLKIVERRIKEALENGEFEHLPGKGKPLALEDDSHIPEDLRIAYKILKNADCLPPEIQEKKEIMRMEDMLASVPDDLERYKLLKKINYRIMKLNMSGNRSPLLQEKEIYFKKLVDKFAGK
jgi:DnaJ homologue, subfamily C, member 28, conserved domain